MCESARDPLTSPCHPDHVMTSPTRAGDVVTSPERMRTVTPSAQHGRHSRGATPPPWRKISKTQHTPSHPHGSQPHKEMPVLCCWLMGSTRGSQPATPGPRQGVTPHAGPRGVARQTRQRRHTKSKIRKKSPKTQKRPFLAKIITGRLGRLRPLSGPCCTKRVLSGSSSTAALPKMVKSRYM